MRTDGWRNVVLAVSVTLGIAACAHDAKQGEAVRAVRTISIDPQVVLPDRVHYVSAGQVWAGALLAGVGGVIGGLVAAGVGAASAPEHSIALALEKQGINVDAIFVEEMRTALARQTRFRVVEGNADAVMSYKVRDYGFHVAGAFTTKMKVLLKVESSLTGRSEQPIFRAGAGAWNGETTRFTMDEFFADRSRLLAAFHEVAAMVAAKEVNALLRRSGDAAMLPEGGAVAIADDPEPSFAPAMPVTQTAPQQPRMQTAALVSQPVPVSAATPVAFTRGSMRQALARDGAVVYSNPSRYTGAVVQKLAAGDAVQLDSVPLQNDTGSWWYIPAAGLRGWIHESQVQLQ